MNLCILPDNFPPQRGGIATWLQSFCDFVTQNGSCTVIVQKHEGDEFFDKDQSYIIDRVLNVEYNPVQLIQRLYHWAHSLFVREIGMSFADQRIRKDIIKNIFLLSSSETEFFIESSVRLLSRMRENRLDLLFCGRALPAGFTALFGRAIFNLPYVILAHGSELLQAQNHPNRKALLTSVLHSADLVFANSHFTADLLKRLEVLEERIRIVHPGVDPQFFNLPQSTMNLKDRYHLKNNSILLTVSNLVERKGHDRVIESLPLVLKEVPNLIYLIVGEGVQKVRLRYLVDRLNLQNHVRFRGSVSQEQILDYYQMCDLFVMPARQVGCDVEGFGIVYLEANACGKPVIGGRSGGTADAIVHGQTGFLVGPDSIEELADRIIQLLIDEGMRRRMGQAGRKRVLEHFTWEQCNRLMYDQMKHCMKSRE